LAVFGGINLSTVYFEQAKGFAAPSFKNKDKKSLFERQRTTGD